MEEKKLKILFRTSGGRARKQQLGMGHIFRSVNLAFYLSPHKIFFLIEDFGGVKNVLLQKGFQNIEKLKAGIELKDDIIKTKNFVKNKKINILIVDKFMVKSRFLQELRKITKVVLIKDLNKFDYPADLLINGFVGFENKVIKNRYGTLCLLGPSYQILNEKFSKKNQPREKKINILITCGGFDEEKIIDKIAGPLEKYLHNIKTKIILGPVTKKTKRIDILQRKFQKNLEVIQSSDNMYQEISRAKFGICTGGITSYEFACVGTPFAIICDVKHQLTNAKEWQKRMIAINLGLASKDTKKIEKLLEKVVQKKITLKSGSKLIDGLGSKRVTREILKIH